jgi:hypothetical protein
MFEPSQPNRVQGEPGRYLFAQYQNIAIAVWLASADGDGTRAMARFTDRIMHDCGLFSIIHVLEASAGLPTSEARDTLVTTARAHREHLVSAGALLLQPSMVAMLMRAFVRGIRTLVRGEVAIQIERQASTLTDWMAPRHTQRTGVRVTTSELQALIADARERAETQQRSSFAAPR